MDRNQSIEFVHGLLQLLVGKNGSDLFLTADFPPAMKIDGEVIPVSQQALSGAHTAAIARSIMNDRQSAEFERTKECNFAIKPTGVGRFRVNVFFQQGNVGIVMRTIADAIPTIEQLGLPPIIADLAMSKRGIVMVVGATGSGKSTTMAAMIGHRNERSRGHIITLEDPIEFVHPHRNSIVTQREIGVDSEDWHAALKNTLRQAPDVILIGEVRDRATMEHAIEFAETGHLVMCTLHANNTNQALDRVINMFPEDRRQQLLMDLSLNLRGILSQRLIPKKHNAGRVAAIEILLASPLVSDLIFKGEVVQIREAMKSARPQGMQTFDQAIFDLHESGLISYEDALRNADSVNDLRLQIKLRSSVAGGLDGLSQDIAHLAIV